MTRMLTILLWLAVSLGASALVWVQARWQVEAARPLVTGEQGFCLEVTRGMSLTALARTLQREGHLGDARWFLWQARLGGQAGRLQAGEYRIEPGTTAGALLAQLASGRVWLHGLSVPEGIRFSELRRLIETHPAIEQTLFTLSDAELMARLGFPGQHPEGRFFPDTYRFARGTSDAELLRWAHAALEGHLARAWENRAPELPLSTPDEALILASIVEKETGRAEERGRVAGVFINRLRKGMRLQTDPTVIYGLGAGFDGDLRRRDLERDTPYNTYTRHGLPPTPIALPGRAAIEAATRPAVTDALYFVADGRGGHVFSPTLDAHNKAVRDYLKTLRTTP